MREHVFNLGDRLERLGVRLIAAEGDRGVHLVHDRGSLFHGIGLIDRHGDRADGRTGEVEHSPFIACGGVDHHGAPRLRAKRHEAFGHAAHLCQHLTGVHVVPLPCALILPLRYQIVRIRQRAVRKQCIDGVILSGDIDVVESIFPEHAFHYNPHARTLAISRYPPSCRSNGPVCARTPSLPHGSARRRAYPTRCRVCIRLSIPH